MGRSQVLGVMSCNEVLHLSDVLQEMEHVKFDKAQRSRACSESLKRLLKDC